MGSVAAGSSASNFSAAARGSSVSMGLSSLAGSVGRMRKPGTSVKKINFLSLK